MTLRINGRDHPKEPQHPEILAISLWRRFVSGGQGPELTSTEAAVALGVSVETVRRLIHSGKLAAFRTPGGRYKILPFLATEDSDNGPRHLIEAWEAAKQLGEKLQAIRRERDVLSGEVATLKARLEELESDLNRVTRPTLLSMALDGQGPPSRQSNSVQQLIEEIRGRSRRKRNWRIAG